MIGHLLVVLLLMASGAGSPSTMLRAASPPPPPDVRIDPDNLDAIEAVGSASELWERPGTRGPGPRTPVSGVSEPYCPPQEYRWGKYRTIVTDCSGVPPGEWTPWFENQEGEDAEQTDETPGELIVVSREDVQTLIVNPGNLIVQPDRSWVLVNADTIVMTDASEHILSTRVLDLDIDVRVTPVLFTWGFGDGSAPVTGTDPGAPWPDHTVSHVYGSPGAVSISLRTEWDAAFRVEGTSTWIPVTGRAVTIQSTDPIEVVTATPRLTTG